MEVLGQSNKFNIEQNAEMNPKQNLSAHPCQKNGSYRTQNVRPKGEVREVDHSVKSEINIYTSTNGTWKAL